MRARFAAMLAGVALPLALPAQTAPVTEYAASYEVRYKGRRVAEADFAVARTATGEYRFDSSTRARGLLRLASPNPAIERSLFRVSADGITPTRFVYEDGSRKGDDNYAIEFAADTGEVRVTGAEVDLTLPYAADLLDRGSLQVALMSDLSACRQPGPYRYVEDDGIRTYRYEPLEAMTTETGIGAVATVRFAQQREGSSRRTILWLAPDYRFVPVRIEQIRDGEIETVFMLDTLTGIAPAESPCSGFR